MLQPPTHNSFVANGDYTETVRSSSSSIYNDHKEKAFQFTGQHKASDFILHQLLLKKKTRLYIPAFKAMTSFSADQLTAHAKEYFVTKKKVKRKHNTNNSDLLFQLQIQMVMINGRKKAFNFQLYLNHTIATINKYLMEKVDNH